MIYRFKLDCLTRYITFGQGEVDNNQPFAVKIIDREEVRLIEQNVSPRFNKGCDYGFLRKEIECLG